VQRQPQQLQLWPALPKTAKGPQVWEALAPEEQTAVISRLARLIRRAADPEKCQQIQEVKHEP